MMEESEVLFDSVRRKWHDQVKEEIVDPEREIIDPHHHLWSGGDRADYLLEDFWLDTGSGHNIKKTVFIQCRTNYRTQGPEHLKPVGETEFVATLARQSEKGAENRAKIAGIVAYADLTLGELVNETLDAHEEAGSGFFRGIRHSGAREENPEGLINPGLGIPGQFSRQYFREGVKLLGRRGLTYESWHFHHQMKSFIELAKKVPDTVMILDHFGTPLGVGAYEGKQDEIFLEWKEDIAELATCDNVYAKLGGMAMPDNGFGWHDRSLPPSSDEFVAAQKKYYLHTIDCFGPDRCMFESNFPVDGRSISYHVLWNGFKRIAADFSEDEQALMFCGTATKVYKLS
jgi:predicted TIM-barrel fold metal-dependent hydrolase